MKNPHQVRGSELALEEAVRKLQAATHTGSIQQELGNHGQKFAEEVKRYVARINEALAYHASALAYYKECH